MYLKNFRLVYDENDILWSYEPVDKSSAIANPYPFSIFPNKGLYNLSFEKITVLCGGNGSGKSTLLNIMAEKLGLKRIAPFNSSELFQYYVKSCAFEMGDDEEGIPYAIPDGSRIITSDDIFDYMLTARINNSEFEKGKREAVKDRYSKKYGSSVIMHSLDDYEELRLQVQARKSTMTYKKFVKQEVGEGTRLISNGETALMYFEKRLKNDTLFLLDEPENSLSPRMQLELKRLIEEKAHYCGCQFVIATHSPFLLSLNPDFTKVYNLDSYPVKVRNWWELENVRTYYEFLR